MPDKPRGVVVTGIGPVTSIGVGGAATWDALAAGRSNVSSRRLAVDLGQFSDFPVAAMPVDDDVLGLDKYLAFLAEQDAVGYRDLAYGLLAIELALADAGLDYDRQQNSIGAIQAYEAPGVERTVGTLLEMMASVGSAAAGPPGAMQGPPQTYPLLAPKFYNAQPFVYVHMAAKAFGLHGLSTSVHNACGSGAIAIELAAQQIRSGRTEAMIVFGGEAFDTAVRLEWFRRLEMYADDGVMRPFDQHASGFCVGEGAAALVLESQSHAARRGATVWAHYLGGAFAQQAWKHTVPDVRAARLAGVIASALDVAGVGTEQLDLVVPHGAAVRVSDGYETACIKAALQGATSAAVATAFKPQVGHMLAASVIIETACMVQCMRHGMVPATLNTNSPDDQLPLALVKSNEKRSVGCGLKLATGFTGHDAALVFSAP